VQEGDSEAASEFLKIQREDKERQVNSVVLLYDDECGYKYFSVLDSAHALNPFLYDCPSKLLQKRSVVVARFFSSRSVASLKCLQCRAKNVKQSVPQKKSKKGVPSVDDVRQSKCAHEREYLDSGSPHEHKTNSGWLEDVFIEGVRGTPAAEGFRKKIIMSTSPVQAAHIAAIDFLNLSEVDFLTKRA
jgi:hypothetical protein